MDAMPTPEFRPDDVVHQPRGIELLVHGRATSDGAGVKLTRVLTQDLQDRLDPFLMLDCFGSDSADDYIAGFPDHPHRGFETITYMLHGRMLHRDSAGHEGLLEGGDVQWMTAGRGVIHSEIPQQTEGRMEGFQLWLNLPASRKMCVPWYRDIAAASLPRLRTAGGIQVTVIAGQSHGVTGAVTREFTQPLYLDVRVPAGAQWCQALPPTHNAFVYLISGALSVAGQDLPLRHMAVLENRPDADGVVLLASADAHLLLIAGAPLHEPIVQHGPFVMNTVQQIHDAVADYRSGKLGT